MLSRFSLYFAEVAKRGSIRQASDYLNISPSAIDRQLLNMEARLGAPLFERTVKGLKLTSAGEFALASVMRLQREAALFRSRMDELRGLRRGEVSVAVVEGAVEFLAEQLAAFHQSYPAITHTVQVASSLKVSELVRSGEAEVGIAYPGDHADMRVEQAMLYAFGLIVDPEHRFADLAEIEIAQCLDERFIMPDENLSLRRLIEQAWWTTAGVKPQAFATVNSLQAVKALVRKGLGVAVMSPLEVALEREAGLLNYVPLVGRGLMMANYSTFTAAGRTLSAAASLMVQHLAAGMSEKMAAEDRSIRSHQS